MTQPLEPVPESVHPGPARQDFGTIAIVGVGLIGGSIALAAKSRAAARHILGVGRSLERLAEARRRGVIDEGVADLTAAARQADVIIFCTPVDQIAGRVLQAAAACRTETLISDAGSVKGCIVRDVEGRLPPGVAFVGAHPLAGSEKQGFEHADPRLFEGRVCVVTPVESTPRPAIDRISHFWRRLGATLVQMSPEQHDKALAETSHLPHLVAASLAATLSDAHRALTASGFRDTTRIAGGDSGLWTAILLGNRAEVLESLARYEGRLHEFRTTIERNDSEGLQRLLAGAQAQRNRS